VAATLVHEVVPVLGEVCVTFTFRLLVVACFQLSLVSLAVAAESRPNIVLIMSDDMGFSDIGCYGGEAETPVLNRLAENGLRFTQFYNTARCCPTRASLLTGLYPHQAGVGWMMSDNGYDGYRGELNRTCRTIAEVLKPAGYGTYMSGKWHVTKHVKPDGPKENWPLQRGFDRFYGTIHGAGSFFDPNSLTRDNAQISPFSDPLYQPDTYYYTDAISDHAVRFINEHDQAAPEDPLFVYVAYTAAHWPMHALPEDIEKYKGRFDAGYDVLRDERLQRMKQMGLVSSNAEMSPVAEAWDGVAHRAWELRCMEVYAAMIDRMDQGIGRIVAALEATNRLDNTLIFFVQDNGGCAEGLGRNLNKPLVERASEPTLPAMPPDALQTDMVPKQSRDGYPVLQGPGVMPGPADTYIAYGRGWANVSNTPFREYKHWVHEGGISTPLIVHWPDGVERGGAMERQPGHLIDVMATCVDVSGAEYPAMVDGNAITPLEGRSLVPAFRGHRIDRDALYWEHEGNRAIRVGDWKLVAKGSTGPWELYHISEDRSELHDLAAERPRIVERLAQQWQEWAERAHVLPLTPYYQKKNVKLSRKKRFLLSGGDSLTREQSPNVAERPFTATIEITSPGSEGVLLAQGGTAAGYSLYLSSSRLWFAIRRQGELHVLEGLAPESVGELRLDVSQDGHVRVTLSDRELLTGTIPGLLTTMPIDGLQVGYDAGGIVGRYAAEFPFDGKIGKVKFVLR
jgi:arylsulfatase A-like enzyme